ncbi:hypothetical protein P7C73_g330, partial [Tremellales sp. Uapishka_1]
MGVFSRKKKPAFTAPELPMSTIPNARKGSIQSGRKPSLFPIPSLVSLRSTPSVISFDPVTHLPTHPGQQQTTFLGRRMSSAVMPAFAREAKLAVAEMDKNPSHLRMGESDPHAEADMEDLFYNVKLTLDAPDDDEEPLEPLPISRKDKGKGRADGESKPGWEVGPPRSVRKKAASKLSKKEKARRHRQKRVTRALDEDLDEFNYFAQNGLTPIVGSTTGSRAASVMNVPTTPVLQHASTVLDGNEVFLPKDEHRAVPVGDGFDALDIMADHIFRIGVQQKKWFKAPRMGRLDEIGTGVTIRAKTGLYRTFPVDYEALEVFEIAIKKLNPEVAIKINCDAVRNVIRTYV